MATQRTSKTNTRGYRDADGTFFGSAAEHNRWLWLQEEQRAGRVGFLLRQVNFDICINGVKVGKYRADAVYFAFGRLDNGVVWQRQVVEDVKGWDGHGAWPFRKKVIEAACGFTILEVPAAEWSDRACAKREKEAAMASYLSWQGAAGEELLDVIENGIDAYREKFGPLPAEVLVPDGLELTTAGPMAFRGVSWLRVPNEAKRQAWTVLLGPVPEGAG